MSMAVGLEARVPYCDHRLVQYVWNTPWSMKVADGREKSLLRAAVSDLLPAPILTRPKSGYPASFAPEYERTVFREIKDILSNPQRPLHDCLDRTRVQDILNGTGASMTHAGTAHFLIPLVEVDRWLAEYKVSLN